LKNGRLSGVGLLFLHDIGKVHGVENAIRTAIVYSLFSSCKVHYFRV
jgi:hypothetical protein